MVSRPEVVALSIDLPPAQCLAAVIDSPFTRYPVYRGTLENIVGILHVRDLFSALNDVGIEQVKIQELLRPAHLVPETKDLAALLADFRRTGQHMAIVVDEYGGMDGIVTLEDLLEEIVGKIRDEVEPHARDIVRESLNILLEGLPRGIELRDVTASMRAVAGVLDVHDLHIWSLGSSTHALSCHVLIEDVPPSESDSILHSLSALLERRFGIAHTTVQFEHVSCAISENGCAIPVPHEHEHPHPE